MNVASSMGQFCAIVSSDRSRSNDRNSKSHSLGRRSLLGLKVPRDQARALIETEIGPGPLEQDRETISEADQKNNVDEQPRQPRRNSAEMDKLQVRDRFVSADRRHAAFVEIPKPPRLSAVDHPQNIAGCVTALLHRHRRDSG